jgi:hypothetical protein
MDEKITFNSLSELMLKLNTSFPDLEPSDLRDTIFLLGQFNGEVPLPEETLFYITDLPLEGLEVISEERVSEVLVGGMAKFETLKYKNRKLPPLVVAKGGFRQVIIHGELYALEAYARSIPLKSIVFDVGDRDPFEAFKLDPTRSVFLS